MRQGEKMTAARTRVARGFISGLLHEGLLVVLAFAGMIVLVRLLTPEDYGQAAAAVGVLALIGVFRGAMFVEHALQCTKDEEPDWDTYFAIVGLVQITLCGLTLLVSLACLTSAAFAPLTRLLQVAALGFLLDWPAQVASVKLRRELRLDRLKLISGVASLLRTVSAIVLAWSGLGAMALIISGNVLSAAPMALYWLLVERWRPRTSWLFVPRVASVSPILRFGVQQLAGSLAQSLRTAAESLVLTSAFGAATFGLLNRAQALYQSTIGRLGLVLIDAAYPLLPMERADPKRYAHRATRFIEAALILTIPGAAFIAIEGASVSRLLYGNTWGKADPYLAPGAVAVAATGLVYAASAVVMGMGRVRAAVVVESAASVTAILALSLTYFVTDATPYVWGLAATQTSAAAIAFRVASPYLEGDWMRRGLWPAMASALLASAVVLWLRWGLVLDPVAGLGVTASAYAAMTIVLLTLTARPLVLEVVRTQRALRWSGVAAVQSQA